MNSLLVLRLEWFVCYLVSVSSFARLVKTVVVLKLKVYCGCLMKKRWLQVQLKILSLILSTRLMVLMIMLETVSNTMLFLFTVLVRSY